MKGLSRGIRMRIRRPRPGSGCLWCLAFLGFDFGADDGAGTLGADGWEPEGAAGMISPNQHVESASTASWARKLCMGLGLQFCIRIELGLPLRE
jgi:hypothetical protein